MPTLGEYLGTLLAEITSARLQADLEAARIAQLYASHPLLQHMPVPRFRLPSVSLDLPVAVEKIDPPPPVRPADLRALRRTIDDIIDGELKRIDRRLPANLRKRLTENLSRLFDRLKTSAGLAAFDAVKLTDDAVAATIEVIEAADKEQTPVDPAFEVSLRRRFAVEFLKFQRPPPRVQVLLATAQLKEIAPPWSLTRIHLTISEEGVEWTQTNPSDDASKTLLPE